MNNQEALDLKRLISQNNEYVDNTEGIRKLRHSDLIKREIIRLQHIISENKYGDTVLLSKCQTECSFLYNSYTDIFNRVYKNELDLELLFQALEYLKKIEDGHIDQQEGSVMMGKLLHKVYVNSALRKANNLEKDNNQHPSNDINKGQPITWKQFKNKM